MHTVKGFGIVNKAEIDVFLELSYVFDDPADVDSLVSGSSAFSKSSLNIWNFMVHVLLKPGLENFEHYFPSVWAGRFFTTEPPGKPKPLTRTQIFIRFHYGIKLWASLVAQLVKNLPAVWET